MFTLQKFSPAHALRLGITAGLALAATAVLGFSQVTPIHADNSDLVWRGLIGARPEGKIGNWQVGGRIFQAIQSTEFNVEEGPLAVGACAKVKYVMSAGNAIAREIDSEPMSDCAATSTGTPTGSSTATSTSASTSTTTSTPPGTSTPNPGIEREFQGIINSRPDGNVGVWVIGGRAFVAGANTEIKNEDGPLSPGVCAKVHFTMAGDIAQAREIESESDDDCGHHEGGTPTGTPAAPITRPLPTLFTVKDLLVSRPDGLLGAWVISATEVQANNNTEFDGSMNSLAVGQCVKARYYVSGTFKIARSIEAEPGDCDNQNRPTPTSTPEGRQHSRVLATISELPTAPYIGSWLLEGVAYQASSDTRMLQSNEPFTIGVCVRAHYSLANSVRTLLRVESMRDQRCEHESSPAERDPKLYGVIDSFTTTVPSVWQISGISITVNASTTIEADHGPFTKGAFVEVRFKVISGTLIASKIETHMVPGHGEHNRIGRLTGRPSDDLGDWMIDGQRFVADRAIHVSIDASAGLSRSEARPMRVAVNYTTVNGVNIATSIRQLSSFVYLPSLGN